ncbi:helix-turn-helix domain-containing protein [Aquimarina rhabdastrellae]
MKILLKYIVILICCSSFDAFGSALFLQSDLASGLNKSLQRTLNKERIDSIHKYEKLAFESLTENNVEKTTFYIQKYIEKSLDITFIEHSKFVSIHDTDAYQKLKEKYLFKVDSWTVFYIYTAFIGFFIALVLNLKSDVDRIATLLISGYVFIHSFFISHICVQLTNLNFKAPDTFLMSTSFSFLYGPLLYFYFKRIKEKYLFKWSDVLHLIPSAIITICLIPIYTLTKEEKMEIMLGISDIDTSPYLYYITLTKFISLFFYMYLVYNVYKKESIMLYKHDLAHKNWQKRILIFNVIYVISYAIYGILIVQRVFSGFLFHVQVTSMALLVFYVGCTSYIHPILFKKRKLLNSENSENENKVVIASSIKNENVENIKYQKSGLTEDLSKELKEKLNKLLEEDKVYRLNNVSLAIIADKLGTSRHNTSQIINEHFGLNFFELINSYRIKEAMDIIKNNQTQKLSIIEIAYEVGFNNKVTFNKSFKKENDMTPSEYMRYIRNAQLI